MSEIPYCVMGLCDLRIDEPEDFLPLWEGKPPHRKGGDREIAGICDWIGLLWEG